MNPVPGPCGHKCGTVCQNLARWIFIWAYRTDVLICEAVTNHHIARTKKYISGKKFIFVDIKLCWHRTDMRLVVFDKRKLWSKHFKSSANVVWSGHWSHKGQCWNYFNIEFSFYIHIYIHVGIHEPNEEKIALALLQSIFSFMTLFL